MLWRENFTALRALPVQYVRSARLRVEGMPTVGVLLHPSLALVSWWWYGNRSNVTVERVAVAPNRRWWKCPACGRITHTLLFSSQAYGCRRCLRVGYGQWRRNGRGREPKKLETWLQWQARRLEKMARRAGCAGSEEVAHFGSSAART